MTDNTETLYNALDKIKELEKENTKLKETNNTLYESVMKVGKRNNELKAQIEIMKCCANCEHYNRVYGLCNFSLGDKEYHCRLRKWELAE